MAPLINGINIDGSLIKETFSGVGGLLKDIRSAITGKVDPSVQAMIEDKIIAAENQINLGQIDVNKIEAASSSVFVAGWRPAIGWVCAAAMATYYIPQALLASILWTIQCSMVMWNAENIAAVALPSFPLSFNMAEIIGLVMSLLGLSTLRTVERTKNVAR